MGLRVRVISWLLLAVVVGAQAEDSFCLSGGNRTGFACGVNSDGSERQPDMLALQVLVDADNDRVIGMSPAPLLYEAVVPGDKRLLYFGGFENRAAADAARDSLLASGGLSAPPLLVVYTPRSTLPHIRLLDTAPQFAGRSSANDAVANSSTASAQPVPVVASAEVEISQVEPLAFAQPEVESPAEEKPVAVNSAVPKPADGSLLAAAIKPKAVPVMTAEASDSELRDSKVGDSQFPLIYAVQVAAFKGPVSRKALVEQYPQQQLLCRQKQNGLYVAYYGLYNSWAAAKAAAHAEPWLLALGAYPVKLKDVYIEPCAS